MTNADDTQAQVDLRFYGRDGRVVVPGSPGLVIDARSSRTVSLSSLVKVEGPLGMAVQAGQGRVTAVAKRTRSDGLKPVGVDWQIPTTAPALSLAIPGVPEDKGSRELVVTNPGLERASVTVQVLGLQGPYAPVGAETVTVPPESSAAVDLAPGLAGEAGTVKLVSDQPVVGAVISSSERSGAQPDIAIQSSAAQLVRTGVSALAVARSGHSELVLSNAGPTDAAVSFEVLSSTGWCCAPTIAAGPDSTATRRLTSTAPSYLVVKVPDGSAVVGEWCSPSPMATSPAWPPFRSPRPMWPAGPRVPTLDPSVGRGPGAAGPSVWRAGAVRVDLVNAAAGKRGQLLDDGAVDQDPQSPAGGRPMLQRPP